MRYLIWFCSYFLNNQPYDFKSYVLIQPDSIEFYILDLKYVKWKIDTVFQQYHNRIRDHHGNYNYSYYPVYSYHDEFLGIYQISFHDLKGIVRVTESNCDITILSSKDDDQNLYHITYYKCGKRKK